MMSLRHWRIDATQPFNEVGALIARTLQEALPTQWVKTHASNRTHDLILSVLPTTPHFRSPRKYAKVTPMTKTTSALARM